MLGHEIGHVARKHTINAIQKGNATKLAAEAAASRAAVLGAVANAAYSNIIENAFDRGDEMDADRLSVQLTQKSGYAAGTLGGFLTRLSDRNKDAQERNGLFASHPETKERITAIGRLAASSKTTALAKARYDATRQVRAHAHHVDRGRDRGVRRADRLGRQGAGEEGRAEAEDRPGPDDARSRPPRRRSSPLRCPPPEAHEGSARIAPRRAAAIHVW